MQAYNNIQTPRGPRVAMGRRGESRGARSSYLVLVCLALVVVLE